MGKGKRVRNCLRTFALLLLGTFLISYALKPLGNYMTRPVAALAALMLRPFYDVSLRDSVIVGDGLSVEVIPPCTPIMEWALFLTYLLLTWRGRRDVIAIVVSFLYFTIVDSLRIALIFLFMAEGFGAGFSHDVITYITFLVAFFIVVWIRERGRK